MRIWQVVVVVMLVGGCEIDTSPPQVVELQTACQMDFRPDTSHRQIVDVTVLEYGTRTPIGDVTVELARNLPLQMTSLTTNDEGLAHFDLPTENWHVSRVVDPDYVTACPPTFEDNDWHHPLVEKRHGRDRDEYTCLLVPFRALRVRDKASALRFARTNDEVAPWLRSHPNAELVRIDLRGMHWQVMFDVLSEQSLRMVVVDALDGRTRVGMEIDDSQFGDYLPSEYGM